MHSITSEPVLIGSVDGGKLEFEVVRLQRTEGLGIVRRLEIVGVALYEMNLVFDSREAFLDWIEFDEYRHQAPGLMAFVKNRFDELYYSPEGNHEKKPCGGS